jgi:hypothetical protein
MTVHEYKVHINTIPTAQLMVINKSYGDHFQTLYAHQGWINSLHKEVQKRIINSQAALQKLVKENKGTSPEALNIENAIEKQTKRLAAVNIDIAKIKANIQLSIQEVNILNALIKDRTQNSTNTEQPQNAPTA